MRVIVCGSRDWTDAVMIGDAIRELRAISHPRLTIVHGAGPTGADRIADSICRRWGIVVEPHPADWKRYGKRAGPIRNREMLDLGAAVVYGFKDGFDWTLAKGGTEHMISLADEAGVPYVVQAHDAPARSTRPVSHPVVQSDT